MILTYTLKYIEFLEESLLESTCTTGSSHKDISTYSPFTQALVTGPIQVSMGWLALEDCVNMSQA